LLTPANRLNLKSRVPKGTYRFNSGPGHQAVWRGHPCRRDPSTALGISAAGSQPARSNLFRSHLPKSAAASYVLCRNSRSAALGLSDVRTSSYISKNSFNCGW